MHKINVSQLSNMLSSLEVAIKDVEDQVHGLILESDSIIEKSLFSPEQDERFAKWFTNFLNIRNCLWELIDSVYSSLEIKLKDRTNKQEYQLFVIGFVSACQIVRLDRLLLEKVANHSIVQRKLNEGIPQYNVPRKQFSYIFEAYVDASKAYQLRRALKFLDKNSVDIYDLSNDPQVGKFVQNLQEYRSCLDESKLNYFKRLWQFILHAVLRRGATIKQHTQFGLLELSGRIVSEVVNKNNKNVDGEIRQKIRETLKPGDVIITRHRYALTNLFLPGFWPHAALYVGSEAEREKLGIHVSQDIAQKWCGDVCTFEALKDGVLFRSLESTLSVDSFVVLRPDLTSSAIKEGIERVIIHEGKQYNFDFDFFSSDRLVCTEIVYRAYDGLEGIKFEINKRAGRPALSAEELCDLALDSLMFDAVAICLEHLETDELVVENKLRESYRK